MTGFADVVDEPGDLVGGGEPRFGLGEDGDPVQADDHPDEEGGQTGGREPAQEQPDDEGQGDDDDTGDGSQGQHGDEPEPIHAGEIDPPERHDEQRQACDRDCHENRVRCPGRP